MLHKTQGIVLRAVKYGDTSLVVTMFTEQFGVQAYMMKGVRSSAKGRNRAAYFQVGSILDMVVYMQAGKNMQHVREYNAAHVYLLLHEDVVRNSILLFSSEVLLRLLPEHAPLPALFDYAKQYLVQLDSRDAGIVANYPLYFLLQCSRLLGYEPIGAYSAATPHLNVQEGGFADHPPAAPPYTTDEDAHTLHQLIAATNSGSVSIINMNSETRARLIDWYIAFLQQHSQHLGNIRSLAVLRAILH
jgi:DNA repair protein RecO (recombination protein O)